MFYFFFNDTATTEIYTLSLHDALPIFVFAFVRGTLIGPSEVGIDSPPDSFPRVDCHLRNLKRPGHRGRVKVDRKSTRLNSSHANISYAVFCLKKKTNRLFAPLPLSHTA